MTASQTARALESGELTTVEVTEQLIGRIKALDSSGPQLRAVLELSPDALDLAVALDVERRSGQLRGPLHGVPVFVKDNIDTVAPLHTTGGSFVFGDGSPAADAPVVDSLRAAGALILGKTNLSEWANFRGRPSASGWSAAGGQTRNPHVLDRTPGGSSSGSASALSARLVPLALGTETDGSILCPAAACGVVGLKPTVGLLSCDGIIPISHSQDTPGPLGRSVEDVALLLEVIARVAPGGGSRPPGYQPHYLAQLGDGNLAGLRVGVLRQGYTGYHAPTDRVFAEALEALASCGATIVDPVVAPNGPLFLVDDEIVVLTHEFGASLDRYLDMRATSGSSSGLGSPRSLDEVIALTESIPAERRDVFGIELLVQSAATAGLDSPAYLAAFERNRRRVRADGLDRIFAGAGGGDNPAGAAAGAGVDLIAVPAMTPAWLIDHVIGDEFLGTGWSPPAVAGYPSATIPIGMVGGLPVGAALWGPPWSEAMLLRVMFSLERALGSDVTSPVPAFVESVSLRT
ncbi:MAG: amidase family protein [Acidimicrobiales bacterium]